MLQLMPGPGLDPPDGTHKLIGWTQFMPLWREREWVIEPRIERVGTRGFWVLLGVEET